MHREVILGMGSILRNNLSCWWKWQRGSELGPYADILRHSNPKCDNVFNNSKNSLAFAMLWNGQGDVWVQHILHVPVA